MEQLKKSPGAKFRSFVLKLDDDNLFLLASSVSYYSALAIAPFLLILLGVASLIGEDIQLQVTNWAAGISPAVGRMMDIIFDNVQEGVNIGSISGIIGLVILFWTASLVFLQLRYSMDVIYNNHQQHRPKSIWVIITDKLFAMFIVFLAGIFLIIFSALPGIIYFVFNEAHNLPYWRLIILAVNFIIYTWMFWLIHYVTPTKRPKKREAFKMGVLSALFFIVGNILLGMYFKTVAGHSIYGAAASLLVFLIWCYYSSFTLFLSAEVFLYLKKMGKLK